MQAADDFFMKNNWRGLPKLKFYHQDTKARRRAVGDYPMLSRTGRIVILELQCMDGKSHKKCHDNHEWTNRADNQPQHMVKIYFPRRSDCTATKHQATGTSNNIMPKRRKNI